MPKKNPSILLKKLRPVANRTIRAFLGDPTSLIPPTKKRYLPANSYLRDLYNQSYYCLYAGLFDSSLSLSLICLERISRDFYNKFIGDDTDISWNQILDQLDKHFGKNKSIPDIDKKISNNDFLILFQDIRDKKDEVRNLLLHGKVDEFIKKSILEQEAINVSTGKRETIKRGYIEAIDKDKKMEIKHQRVAFLAFDSLQLVTIVIEKFNKYINTSKL